MKFAEITQAILINRPPNKPVLHERRSSKQRLHKRLMKNDICKTMYEQTTFEQTTINFDFRIDTSSLRFFVGSYSSFET
jgi:hypothetical protein